MTLWERSGNALVDVEAPERHLCPDCGNEWNARTDPVECPSCRLAMEDVAAGAQFFDRLREADAYDLDDPKHPTFHDRYSALADDR